MLNFNWHFIELKHPPPGQSPGFTHFRLPFSVHEDYFTPLNNHFLGMCLALHQINYVCVIGAERQIAQIQPMVCVIGAERQIASEQIMKKYLIASDRELLSVPTNTSELR